MNRSSSLSGVKLRSAAAVLAAMLALALAAAGCGEKEEPPTTGPVVAQTTTGKGTTQNGGNQGQPATDEEQVKTTVATYLTKAKAPDVCTKLVTPQFVERSYGNVKGCEAARKPSAMAKAVTRTVSTGRQFKLGGDSSRTGSKLHADIDHSEVISVRAATAPSIGSSSGAQKASAMRRRSSSCGQAMSRNASLIRPRRRNCSDGARSSASSGCAPTTGAGSRRIRRGSTRHSFARAKVPDPARLHARSSRRARSSN